MDLLKSLSDSFPDLRITLYTSGRRLPVVSHWRRLPRSRDGEP